MSDRKEPFNLLGMAGLGPRRQTPEQKKYAPFNRRMMAATIDSIIIMFTVAPFVDYLFSMYYGPFPLNMRELQAELSGMDPNEANRIFLQRLVDSGAVARWIDNATVQAIVYMVLSGICWRFWSATPGKMIMRMKVVDAKTEQPISDMQILLRLSGYGISTVFFLLGFIWIGIDKRKQAWHDKLAGTVVVNIPWRKPAATPGSVTADPSDSPAP